MNKIKISFLFVLFGLLSTACNDDFDKHYEGDGNSTMGQNAIQVLEKKGGFTLFLQMIERAQLGRVLSESGLYTCLAPKDEHVDAYLNANGWTVETMPASKLLEYINYHFISGINYLYNFEHSFENSYLWDDDLISYSSHSMFKTRSMETVPYKYVRIYAPTYLMHKRSDYVKLYGKEPSSDFMVEGAAISETDRDIPTSNGVIHVLEDPLNLTLRMDEMMEKDADLSLIMDMFNRYVGWETRGMNSQGVIDTTRVKYYNVSDQLTGKVLNIADDNIAYTAMLPTNAAMHAYWDEYMTADQLVCFDSIPTELVENFLKSIVKSSGTIVWGVSDIDRNKPYFSSSNGAILPIHNNLSAHVQSTLMSSNGVIYKMDEVPVIPLMSSIEAGLYVRKKQYKEWDKMFSKGYKSTTLLGTDNSTYQHLPKILLIQNDASEAWNNGSGKDRGVDGYENRYLDTLSWRLFAGILDAQLSEGTFEHRFYSSRFGSILYEDGKFIDFKGKEVELTSQEPVWTANNGYIFEIDGIFNALSTNDTTLLMYRSAIETDPELSDFKTLIDRAEMKSWLDQRSTTSYTVFAPVNAAFAGMNVSTMEQKEAEKLLKKHIVQGRKIFTDGASTGVITTLSNNTLVLSGAWDTFKVQLQYSSAWIVDKNAKENANMQCSNGVLHKIDNVIKN